MSEGQTNQHSRKNLIKSMRVAGNQRDSELALIQRRPYETLFVSVECERAHWETAGGVTTHTKPCQTNMSLIVAASLIPWLGHDYKTLNPFVSAAKTIRRRQSDAILVLTS